MPGIIKVLFVFGTRPEAIKMSPVIKESRSYPYELKPVVCVTAQHRQMIDPILKLFQIKPDYDLNIMEEDQSLDHVTITVLSKVGEIMRREKPDCLVVQGDTTTAMAAAMAAFYQKIRIGHVEAGLRTWDRMNPYPEEINRRIIDSMSDLLFPPTERCRRNLLQEGIPEENILVTGNTVIDALLNVSVRDSGSRDAAFAGIPFGKKKIILVTAHRRENFGEPLINICNAVREIAGIRDDVCVVYPVHMNPNVQKTVRTILNRTDNVFLTGPLEYEPFCYLMKKSYLILTDSGGIQEEAPGLGKPVLVLRETTERPEAVEAGIARIVGTNTERIVRNVIELLEDRDEYERMSRAVNPYGDGRAGKRIVDYLLRQIKRE